MRWKVGVVEDDPAMRAMLVAALGRDARWDTVFAVGSVAEVQRLVEIAAPPPDTVLVDLGLPDGSGLDLIGSLRRHWPACECLVISVFGDEDRVIRSIEAGAAGYILKGQGEADVAEHLGHLREGGSPMSPAVARHLLRRVGRRGGGADAPGPGLPAATRTLLNDLTAKELEVLKLLSLGEPYDAVAARLDVSVNTVRFHVKGLYGKLGVNSRQKAVIEGFRRQLIDPAPGLGTTG